MMGWEEADYCLYWLQIDISGFKGSEDLRQTFRLPLPFKHRHVYSGTDCKHNTLYYSSVLV